MCTMQATLKIYLVVLCFLYLLQFCIIRPPFPILSPDPESGLDRSLSMSSSDNKREVHGVKIWTNPPESVLSDLGVFAEWKRFASDPAKIPWTFDSGREKMYLLKGKVTVYCDGHHDEPFQIAAGDLVEFPAGMKIIFEIVEALDKHFLVIKD